MNSNAAAADRVPVRSPSTAWQIVEGELILLRLKHDELLGLNAVVRCIWEMADGTRTVAQIGEALASKFDVSTETASADSCCFVAELAALCAIIFRANA